jgi:hypothetical protein
VRGVAGQTGRARAAKAVDLAYHSLADQGRILATLHYPHEFVSQNTPETQITTGNLQVRVADACQLHPHQSLSGRGRRLCIVSLQLYLTVINEGAHVVAPSSCYA